MDISENEGYETDKALHKLIVLDRFRQLTNFFHLCIYNLTKLNIYFIQNPIRFATSIFTNIR